MRHTKKNCFFEEKNVKQKLGEKRKKDAGLKKR